MYIATQEAGTIDALVRTAPPIVTIQKSGTATISDVPDSAKNSEFNAIVYGSTTRRTILLSVFTASSRSFLGFWFVNSNTISWVELN